MTTAAEYEVMAFAAHPDDAEATCGGTLAKLAGRGRQVAICDLTRGELGTNGTPELRAGEAAAAARVLGIAGRLQAGLPDGGINALDPAQVATVVRLLRRHRPRVVMAPPPETRHPDHAEACRLVARAVFFTAVPRFAPETPAARRPVLLQTSDYWPVAPSFVVDISATLEVKLAALRCYRSQFSRDGGTAPTPLNDPAYLRRIEADARHYGHLAGLGAGEPFRVEGAIAVDDPLEFFAVREVQP